ncbi:MAG: peptide-methionine (S)-S-oxide reductase MsrA [Myxococcota bacterium]|nr:peptide-methionine (S)-S-oxide reductase MsrA [Myxococcota bacterium]
MFFRRPAPVMPTADQALPGRHTPIVPPERHAVLGTPLSGPWPGKHVLAVGMGCFWGAERKFWQSGGVHTTAVGYGAGFTPNPTYKEVCTGRTGHNELVLVVFDPEQTSLQALLQVFWENHDPTQGMRQGNDVGTQYRSGLYYTTPEQKSVMDASLAAYQQRLTAAGLGEITTEVLELGAFYYAEEYHQQYLHKNPNGYCGIGGTGVSCPIGVL